MSEYIYYPPRNADYCSGNGGGSFVNAILRSILRDKSVKAKCNAPSFPSILRNRWIEEFGAEKAEEGKTLLTVTENGFGKRTELPEYLRTGPNGEKIAQGRGGKGLKNYNITPKTGIVAGCRVVGENDDVMLIENGGVIIRMPADGINTYGRATQGVILMRVEEGNEVISVQRTDKEETE